MNPLERYLEIINTLQENNLSFVVTGTFALYLQDTSFAERYTIKDCDIFIDYKEEIIFSFVSLMKQEKWSVNVWKEEIDNQNLMPQLNGKYYIRCTKDDLVFDATYEHEAEIYGDPIKDLKIINGIPVIAADKILAGKRYRGTERDLRAVECFVIQNK